MLTIFHNLSKRTSPIQVQLLNHLLIIGLKSLHHKQKKYGYCICKSYNTEALLAFQTQLTINTIRCLLVLTRETNKKKEKHHFCMHKVKGVAPGSSILGTSLSCLNSIAATSLWLSSSDHPNETIC